MSDVHLQLRTEQQVDATHENPSSDGQRYIQGIDISEEGKDDTMRDAIPVSLL